MNTITRTYKPHIRFLLQLLLIVTGIAMAAVLAAYLSWQRTLIQQHTEMSNQLALYTSTMHAELRRFEALPYVLALSSSVQNLLREANSPERSHQVSLYLENINREAGSGMLYVLDRDGRTLASSNWANSNNIIGNNYQFRPYFSAARNGGTGRFFGIGVDTHQPGVYIAQPIRINGQIHGVLVVKIKTDGMETNWRKGGEQVLVSDSNGVVIMSTIPAWKFSTLQELSAPVRKQLQASRQYDNAALARLPFDWPAASGDRLRINNQELLVMTSNVGLLDWKMSLLGDLSTARHQAWLSAAVTGFALLALTMAALYARLLRRRRRDSLAAQQTLERTVEERTAELASTNQRLLAEINDKRQAELALHDAQTELIQSSKLRALGLMATHIAHELNQPLAALRSFADNTRQYLALGQTAQVDANLERIIAQTDKLGAMTAELKLFAARRPVRGHSDLSLLQAGLDDTLAPRLAANRAQLYWDIERPCPIPLEPLALEQIIINLVSNAADALGQSVTRDIQLRVLSRAGHVELHISDHGPGLPTSQPDRVFEPFYSSKPYGQGLGLGLAIVAGIVRDAGGDIHASNQSDGGACFSVRLPLAQQETP